MVRLILAAGAATLIAACSGMGNGTYGDSGYGARPAAMHPAGVKAAGGALTGPNGMTLYTFDRDVAGSGRSVCNGQCAANWPPLSAADGKPIGDWSVVKRDDGAVQWAYQGKPLYYWVRDQKPGDRTGDGVNGAWRVAKP